MPMFTEIYDRVEDTSGYDREEVNEVLNGLLDAFYNKMDITEEHVSMLMKVQTHLKEVTQ